MTTTRHMATKYLGVITVVMTTVCMLAAFVVITSPIDPVPLVLPHFYPSAERIGKLDCVDRLGEGLVEGPEDVVMADDGSTLLVTTRDGWVKKVWSNGTVLNWRYVGGSPFGLAVGSNGEILVADPLQGLLNVTKDDETVRVVSNQADGLPFKFTDSVAVARNGQIYFTDASYAYPLN